MVRGPSPQARWPYDRRFRFFLQSFHSLLRANSFHSLLRANSFHSSCGGAGNFFLYSCKERSHQERRHVKAERAMGGPARTRCNVSQLPSETRVRQSAALSASLAFERSQHRFQVRDKRRTCHLRDAVECMGGSSHGALCSDVLSFLVTLFFTRVKKRVTRSSVGGVEALL